jgi:hypothetical protein
MILRNLFLNLIFINSLLLCISAFKNDAIHDDDHDDHHDHDLPHKEWFMEQIFALFSNQSSSQVEEISSQSISLIMERLNLKNEHHHRRLSQRSQQNFSNVILKKKLIIRCC